jgi:hypothetical protein|tara:strand:- start:826 stop:1491 length:666 start_codon:yes stop_codon:yes gene_type:complete
MDIKYKIIKVTPADHGIVVRFYSDTVSEEDLAIRDPATGEITLDADGNIESCRTDFSITLWATPTLTGEALEEKIWSHAPTQWLELLGKVSDASVDTSLSGITLNTVSTKTHTPTDDATTTKRQEIIDTFRSDVAAIKEGYPPNEVFSWDQKYREALIVTSGGSSPTPMLESISVAYGTSAIADVITVQELAEKIILKATAFATAYGTAEVKMKLAIADLG